MEAVVMDMDGVLVDSEGLQLEAANTVLARLGVHLSEEENARYLGMDDPSFFGALKEAYGLEGTIEDLAAAREREVLALIAQGVVPRPGVPELIVGLKMRGYPLALASSSPRAVVDVMLEELGLSRSFDAVIAGDDVERGKPAPDIFLLAARRLGVEPAECLVFEDTLHGVAAARAAGMTPVAVRTRENLDVEFEEAARVYDGFERFDWAFLDDR